jgi:hypothetical protein
VDTSSPAAGGALVWRAGLASRARVVLGRRVANTQSLGVELAQDFTHWPALTDEATDG